jgi:hypothetical protein
MLVSNFAVFPQSAKPLTTTDQVCHEMQYGPGNACEADTAQVRLKDLCGSSQ